MKRLRLLCVLGLVACLALAACGDDDDSSNEASNASSSSSEGPLSGDELRGKSLVIASWGGHWTDATKKYFGEPFAEETGVKVTYVTESHGFGTKVRAQQESGNVQWDLLDAPGEDTTVLRLDGLVEPLPSWLKERMGPRVVDGAVNDTFLTYGSSAGLIACNPDAVKKCPRTAEDFWNVKEFPGDRAISNYPADGLIMALQADGTPKDRLAEAHDLDTAFERLEEIKPHIRVWPESGDQQQQVLRDGEVGMAVMWSTRAFDLKRTSMPNLEISWESAYVASEGWVIPKDAPNKEVAFAFLDWITTHPEAQANWTKSVGAPTPGKEVPPLLPEDVVASMPSANDTVADPELDETMAETREERVQRWQQLLAGG